MYPIAASAFEWVQAVAGAVAALAALGALLFAWLTVRGAQELRRSERRARLLDLAADFNEAGTRVMLSGARVEEGAWRDLRSVGHRFRAAVDSTGESLPACRALLEFDWSPASMGEAPERPEKADKALAASLDELSAWLRE